MTDADVDGAHIRTLLLTLFYRYFPELIKTNHIYIAKPPLYRLQKGKDVRYAYSDAERDQIISEFQKIKVPVGAQSLSRAQPRDGHPEQETETPAEGEAEEEGVTKIAGITIQRYKGLGEMNAEQLWETTMDPKTRTMKLVAIDDAAAADETFDILMGADVAPRRRFIQTHAKTANLDI